MKILAITPEPHAFLYLAPQFEGHELVVEGSVSSGLARLTDPSLSLVLMDSAAHDNVVDLVERIAATKQTVVLLSRSPSLSLTLDALDHGARDVLAFPPSPAELKDVLDRCGAREGPHGANWLTSAAALSDSAAPSPSRASEDSSASASSSTREVIIIGKSAGMLEAVKAAARVAATTATVLIQGESGTGKELLARFLHGRSARLASRFVVVNCAAIPDQLLESELFGHERGAFTGAVARKLGKFERAAGGTLFLDEIGDMALPMQAKILRALQEREIERVGGAEPVHVDVRVVSATNRDLAQQVALGRFREDLYYRLAVVVITLPPLRERGDELRLLAEHAVQRAAHEHHRPIPTIAPETLALLQAYRWPGNVRQLRNVLERAVLMADGPILLPAHLSRDVRNHRSAAYLQGGERRAAQDRRARADRRARLDARQLPPLDALERDYIKRALAVTGGHLGHTAELLGIHRNTLRRRLLEHRLAAATEGSAGQAAEPSQREERSSAESRATRPVTA